MDVPQPEVTEGGVVLHQNNTWPIMAAGCHVVMTANVVMKENNIKWMFALVFYEYPSLFFFFFFYWSNVGNISANFLISDRVTDTQTCGLDRLFFVFKTCR